MVSAEAKSSCKDSRLIYKREGEREGGRKGRERERERKRERENGYVHRMRPFKGTPRTG
jgi:hypothetical protein